MRLTEDSAETSSGGNAAGAMLYKGRLLSVEDRNGTRASARGTVLVFMQDGPRHAWGRTLRFRSSLKESDTDARILLAFPGKNGITPGEWASPLFRARSRALDALRNRIARMDDKTGALFAALFLGIRDDLPAGLSDRFRKSGTIHILALSGMHVSILSGILALALVPLLGKRRAFLTSLIIILIYGFLAGPKPSMLRACVMYAAGGMCLLRRERVDGLRILFLSFFILVSASPGMLRNLSFQLSFLAIFGILTLGRWMDDLLHSRLPSFLRLPLCASFGAQAAVSPLAGWLFGALYPAGMIMSLVLSPLVLAFMWSGILLLVLPERLFLLWAVLNKFVNYLYDAMIMITGISSLAPSLKVPALAGRLLVLFFTLTLAAGFLVRDRVFSARLFRRAK